MTHFTTNIWNWCLVTVVLLLAQVLAVMSLECYDCNSYLDKDCMTASNLDKFKSQCSNISVGCRKVNYFIAFKNEEEAKERIVRQCAKSAPSFTCDSVFGTNGKRYKQIMCECGTDLCNRTLTVKSDLWILPASFMVFITVLYFLGA